MARNAQHMTDKGQGLPGLATGVMEVAPSVLPAHSAPAAGKRFLRWATGLCVVLGICLAVLGVLDIHFSDKDTVGTPVALAETHATKTPIETTVPVATPTLGVTLDADAVEIAFASKVTDVADAATTAGMTVAVIGITETPKIAPATERIEITKVTKVAEVTESTTDSTDNGANKPAGKPTVEPAAEPAPSKAKPPSIKLFGTVEFRGTLKGVPSWTTMLERNLKKPLLVAGAKLNSSTTWDDFKAKLSTMSPMEQIKAVNRFWNQWPYRLDPEVYKKPDYWATPDEFRRNSGDCEDYSIAKYYTLKEMGIPPDDMRIVVLMETIRNIAHAVLVVYMDGDAWILDNLSNNVLSHSRYKNYAPQFSVNEKFRWAHVRPK